MATPANSSLNEFYAAAAKLRGQDERRWEDWRPFYTVRTEDIPVDAERAWLKRIKSSHRGIGQRQALRHLVAAAVDQPFLDEICTIERLERLDLEYPVTASDLSGLRKLRQLRHIGINSPRNVTDFTPLLDLPELRRLLIENGKHLRDVEWLANAHHLEAIGIEGSLWTSQHIASLAPLAGLRSLTGLFLTAVRLENKNLSPLAACPSLQILDCARFVPRAEFERLHRMKPTLCCSWFDPSVWPET